MKERGVKDGGKSLNYLNSMILKDTSLMIILILIYNKEYELLTEDLLLAY